MTNRLADPNIQFLDGDGHPLAGGMLFFYITLSTTPADTFSDANLAVPNTNPVVLDAAGRSGNIFLDPSTTYKVVLKDADGVTVWTADPVTDLASGVYASLQVYGGNPNGNVAGNAGTVGGSGASVIWDVTNEVLYVCTTSGDAASAVWLGIESDFSGDEDVHPNDYVIDVGDRGRIQVANKATAIGFTLPDAAEAGPGWIIATKNINVGSCTVTAADNIDGVGSIAMDAGEFCFFWTNGVTWRCAHVLSSDPAAARAKVAMLFATTEAIKTVDYAIAITDVGRTLIANKATAITFTLPAVATDGVIPYLLGNIGAGTLILDGNGSEVVEGGLNIPIFTGEYAIVWPTGTAWRAMKVPQNFLADDSATGGPALNLDRFSGSPAANDFIGRAIFKGRDSGANITDYAHIVAQILDPTDTSEDGGLMLRTMVAGALTTILTVQQGLQVGAPTGTDKGVGTVNAAVALYAAGRPMEPISVGIANYTLVASVSANALTVALKTLAGGDPSTTDPISISFRSATAATGNSTDRTVTAATSIVVASTKTLGTSSSNVPFRIWIVAVDTGSGIELGVVNALSGINIMALRDDLLYSPTATPGNSALVIYTTSGETTKPIRILGYLDWGSGLATAGTWASGPTKTQLFGPGVAKPGDVVQTVRTDVGTSATGTTAIPFDNTIPQSGEGDQQLSQAITPYAAPNLLKVTAAAYLSNASTNQITAALFRDAVASAVAAAAVRANTTSQVSMYGLSLTALAASTSATTFKVRVGGSSGTTTFNGEGGSQLMGGVMNSFLEVEEYMA